MPSFLLIISSPRPTHAPPLQPLLPLVLVTILVAQCCCLRPYTYPTTTVHHQRTIVEIHDILTNTPSILTPVDITAAMRLSITHIHPIEGFIAAIATVGGGLAVLRQFLHTNRRNFYTRMR